MRQLGDEPWEIETNASTNVFLGVTLFDLEQERPT